MPRLVRDGEVLGDAEVARTRTARRRGLLGREVPGDVMVLLPCRQVHTLGMRFPIDVVWCDAQGRVLHTTTLAPRRVSRAVLRARFVVEAPAGSVARWRLRAGDVVAVDGGDRVDA